MREILRLNARDMDEASDAVEDLIIELLENVDAGATDIEITIKAPDDGGFAFILDPDELK